MLSEGSWRNSSRGDGDAKPVGTRSCVVTPCQPLRSVRRWRKATETVGEKRNAIFFKSTLLLILSLGLLDPRPFLGSALSDLKEEVVQEYS